MIKKQKTRLIVSNGFINILILFNTLLLRLSRIVKMMMMKLNKVHVFVLCVQIFVKSFDYTKQYSVFYLKNIFNTFLT